MTTDAKQTFILNNDYNKKAITHHAEEMIHHNMTVMHNLPAYDFKILKASEQTDIPKNLKRAMGWCNFLTKTIVLNEEYLNVGNLDTIVDTLYHECAHAMAFELHGDTGHGKHWKRICRTIGCDDQAKADLNADNFSQDYVENVREHKAKNSKWAIVLAIYNDNDEMVDYKVMSRCNRRLKQLERRGYKHVPNSVGNLYHIPNEYSDSDVQTITSVMFQ